MSIFFTSDTHFFHQNILKYCPSTRKYANVQEMNEAIVADWNSKVASGDTVFHLGDMSFGRPAETEEILNRLNGRIVLIRGNHDPKNGKVFDILDSRCEEIHEYFELKIQGFQLNMFHYPIRAWNKYHHGAFHLHGHSHGSCKPVGRMLDVGWDNVGRVISLNEVINTLKNVPIDNVDHHDGENPR